MNAREAALATDPVQTLDAAVAGAHAGTPAGGFWRARSAFDGFFALLVAAAAVYALASGRFEMTGYERAILVGTAPAVILLGWYWRPLRVLLLVSGALAIGAMLLYLRTTDGYGADLSQAEHVFLLKYLLASPSAILWMSLLFFMSTIFYGVGFFAGARGQVAESIGSKLAWAGVAMALVGTFVRWFESHQIGPGIGHIPVSNLYEVFVLFAWLTTLFYLYYEARYRTRALGAFVMLVVSAAVGFLLWYTVARGAQEIQPLVPALQSWWMKLHVPANFIGYGSFALAAMVALALLLKTASARSLWIGLVGVPLAAGVVPLAGFALFGGLAPETQASVVKALVLVTALAAFFALTVLLRAPINRRTPELALMDDICYQSITLGFAFFTVATILGALWAADAWGGYWSWDPKETWALIVWLNYAAWLHMRLVKGLRGTFAAWWALFGLVLTTFAFLGVNLFLSGLHSYGEL